MSTREKVSVAVALVLVAVLACAGLLARYVMMHDRDAEMIAAGFHISSNYLKEVPTGSSAPQYEMSRDISTGTFDIDLYNWEVENTDSVSELDITYKVKVTGGTLVSVGGAAAGNADTEYTMPKGATKATRTLVVEPTSHEVTVTVEAIAPYEKTLTAVFDTAGVEVKQVDLGGGVTQLIIITNHYEGDLRLQWDKASFFPNAGVNEQPYGWTVGYEGYAGYSGGEAVRAAKKNSTYYFEFNSTTVSNIKSDFSETGVSYDYSDANFKGATINVT